MHCRKSFIFCKRSPKGGFLLPHTHTQPLVQSLALWGHHVVCETGWGRTEEPVVTAAALRSLHLINQHSTLPWGHCAYKQPPVCNRIYPNFRVAKATSIWRTNQLQMTVTSRVTLKVNHCCFRHWLHWMGKDELTVRSNSRLSSSIWKHLGYRMMNAPPNDNLQSFSFMRNTFTWTLIPSLVLLSKMCLAWFSVLVHIMILELHDVSYIIQHPPVSIISALAGDLANGFLLLQPLPSWLQ